MDYTTAIEKSKGYLMKHKKYVSLAYDILIAPLSKEFNLSSEQINQISQNIDFHDMSKLEPENAIVYARYFWEEPTPEIKKQMKQVTLTHKLTNPHHPEFWLNENGEMQDMPVVYIIEMMCDWWSFGLSQNNPERIFNFYKDNKDKFNFSKNTTKKLEQILAIIKSEIEKPNFMQNE